jgi:hypothetical protein
MQKMVVGSAHPTTIRFKNQMLQANMNLQAITGGGGGDSMLAPLAVIRNQISPPDLSNLLNFVEGASKLPTVPKGSYRY